MNKSIGTVDDYIAAAPKEVRPQLKQLREIILNTAPDAVETISYRMPYYAWNGRLAYFGLAKNHIGLYIPPPILQDHARELEQYGTTKSALHLRLDKKLPVTLIRKLIRARMQWNSKKKTK